MRPAALAVFALCLSSTLAAQDRTPYDDRIHILTSSDGLRFGELADPVFEHGSSPALVRLERPLGDLPAGALLLYFVDFAEADGRRHSESLSVSTSADGLAWSPKRTVEFDSRLGRLAVDPDVVVAGDRLILYFTAPGPDGRDPRIYCATSEDGFRYRAEETPCYDEPGNPEVVRVGDEWLMYCSYGDRTHLARSADGHAWRRDRSFGTVRGMGAGALALPDGTVRLYHGGRGGIVSYRHDPSIAGPPTLEPGLRIRTDRGLVAGANPVSLPDGSVVMSFKHQPSPPRRR